MDVEDRLVKSNQVDHEVTEMLAHAFRKELERFSSSHRHLLLNSGIVAIQASVTVAHKDGWSNATSLVSASVEPRY